MATSDARHRALAAFVAEHRDQLEAYADSDNETAWLAEALLSGTRAGSDTDGEGRR